VIPTTWHLRVLRSPASFLTLLVACSLDQPPTDQSSRRTDRPAPVAAVSAPVQADSSRQPTMRAFERSTWTPVWARGGRLEDSLLSTVRQIVPMRHLVLATDEGTLEIHAFHRSTGELLYSVGGQGGGPGEFRQLSDVLVLPDTQFAVYDRTAQRLTRYSDRGALLGTEAVPQPLIGAESLCVTTTPWMAGITRVPSAWVTIAAHDSSAPYRPHVAYAMALPSTVGTVHAIDPLQANALYGFSARFAQGSVGASCLMTTRFAFGIATVTMPDAAGHGSRLVLFPYVERLSAPRFNTSVRRRGPDVSSTTIMEQGHTAMVHATVSRDTVAVTFLGAPSPDKPVLDLYSALGQYLASWRFPAPVEFGAYDDGMLFTIGGSGVAPQLVAWQRRRAP
jgi:hypothetical protein